MVDTQTASSGNQFSLGTLSILAWIGAPEEDHSTPYLLAYTLGDGANGTAENEAAVAALARSLSLPLDGGMADGSRPGFPVRLLVEGGQAVLSLQNMNAQCVAPPEWLDAVAQGADVHFVLSTRAWPEAAPGQPVSAEALSAYVGDEAVLQSAAHCLLPVGKLR
ncbi:DUF5949 family protein [Streptomyces sp. B-S-A8]|uniref:DUF5949 family protein n=1 Tax=Streptomyces solicavernae TaxID=3043614 RepID=A0ABT6S144_9ACTN|nr:DUF5949 family protein [Streptomyces sp. B-S-A8]MDI3390388.1 DUF5949 family protein [Streptomyces sp. B-S-A8]